MLAVENSSPEDASNNRAHPDHTADNSELSAQSNQARFARDIHALLDSYDQNDAPRLANLGFESHDDGDYFEIEALSMVEDELTQALGIRQESMFESDFDDSIFLTEEDPDPLLELTPVHLDFELHRAHIKRDEEGNTTHTILQVESRLEEDGEPIWCFPDLIHHPDGSVEIALQKVRAPMLLYYLSGNEGNQKISVQYTKSAVDEIAKNALEDIESLPPSVQYQIQLLALQVAFESRWQIVEYVGVSDLRLEDPQELDSEQNSISLSIEPLGLFKVQMVHDPENAKISIGVELIEPYFPR